MGAWEGTVGKSRKLHGELMSEHPKDQRTRRIHQTMQRVFQAEKTAAAKARRGKRGRRAGKALPCGWTVGRRGPHISRLRASCILRTHTDFSSQPTFPW